MTVPDRVLYNGHIYHRPSMARPVQAILVSAGKISAIGSNKQVLSMASRQAEKFDLKHRIVLPGLTDSHIHLSGYAMMAQNLDLSKISSIEEIKQVVRQTASERSSKSWIVGRGWDHEKLHEKRYPTKYDLDIVSNPVFLVRICGHVATVNTAALNLCRITRHTANPIGGEISKDSSNREPDGVLKETALGLVTSSLPQNHQDLERLLPVAADKLLKMGLTALHCIVENMKELRIIRKLREEGEIRQSIYPIVTLSDNNFSRELLEEKLPIKTYLDGSLGARTASLSKHYNDMTSTSGVLRMTPNEFRKVLEYFLDSKRQICTHAIGDRAVHVAIRTLRRVFGVRLCKLLRHRIEHASLTTPSLRSEIKKLGLVLSVQPRFIYSDTWAKQRLGITRARQLYAFRSMLTQGIVLTSGSDAPVENPNPFEGIWSAVTRPDNNTGQAMTVGETISTYTDNAAYASFSDTMTGSLEVGKRADMIVVDRNPFECSLRNLRHVRVVKTIVNGEFPS